MVWVHGAVGVAPGCAPLCVGFEAWYAEDLLRHGFVVVAPDLTGLGIEGVTHPYLHGTSAGQSVLDAARAATALTATGAGTKVALAGHSAGGHAVLWANELAAGVDGDGLEVAVAVPMAPVGDLTVAMTTYARTPGMAAFPIQLAATWPGIEPVVAADVLTRAGHRTAGAPAARSPRPAGPRVRRRPRPLGTRRRVRHTGLVDRACRLSRRRAWRGAAPLLVVHGEEDTAVRLDWAHALVDRLAAAGQEVEFRAHAGADHMGVGDSARTDVMWSHRRGDEFVSDWRSDLS